MRAIQKERIQAKITKVWPKENGGDEMGGSAQISREEWILRR